MKREIDIIILVCAVSLLILTRSPLLTLIFIAPFATYFYSFLLADRLPKVVVRTSIPFLLLLAEYFAIASAVSHSIYLIAVKIFFTIFAITSFIASTDINGRHSIIPAVLLFALSLLCYILF